MHNKRIIPLEELAVTDPTVSYYNKQFHHTFCSQVQSRLKTNYFKSRKLSQDHYFSELQKHSDMKRR
jgi:hypothetical protein